MKNLDEMSKTDRRDLFVEVAEEIQEVCEFEPPIRTEKKSEEELVSLLKEAFVELTADDELSEKAKSVFEQLEFTGPAQATKAKQAGAEVEEDEVVDRDDLVQDITEAKQLNTLKKIAKTNDQFKSLRGIKYTFDTLKKAMLEALLPTEIASEHLKEKDAPKEEGEVQEAEKKPEMKVSKPIKKENKDFQKGKGVKKEKKGISAMYFVRRTVCEIPDIKINDLMILLEKKGFTSIKKSSVQIRKNEMNHAISIMTELGKLK